jgi:hypothetical protein
LSPFFGAAENCADYLSIETFPKFEDKTADKWNDITKAIIEDTNSVFKALRSKSDTSLVP